MNWLGRLLFGAQAPALPAVTAAEPAPVPAEPEPAPTPLTRCPDCEGVDFTRICTIVGVRGTVASERGARYCCEDCASLWSVSPSGVRRANPRAIPVVMQPPKPREPDGSEPRNPPPIRDEGPIPRARPRA